MTSHRYLIQYAPVGDGYWKRHIVQTPSLRLKESGLLHDGSHAFKWCMTL